MDMLQTSPRAVRLKINRENWRLALRRAEGACYEIRRSGGTQNDALQAYGLATSATRDMDWDEAAGRIAWLLIQPKAVMRTVRRS